MKIWRIPVGMLQTNCYLVASERGSALLIDPGADAPQLIQKLAAEKLKLRQILFTHGHFDHIGAAQEILKQYPVPIAIGADDVPMLSNSDKNLSSSLFRREYSLSFPARALREGDQVTLDELTFEVLKTPGHTPGGVTYRCGSTLFTGDTLFEGSVGRTDFEGGDGGALLCSLKKLAFLEGDFKVLPGHGEPTTLEREREQNPYLAGQIEL